MPTSLVTIIKEKVMEYTFTRLSKDNIRDVALLYAEVYGAERPSDYFQHKFNTAYTGAEYAGFIAYTNDSRPVAYFGVIPCFIQYNEAVVLAAQATDAMTHPGHRHKGLFAAISALTFDLCPELGIKLLFGFPNQNSYPAMVRHLGWTETEKMWRFTIPTGSIWDRAISKFSKHSHTELTDDLSLRESFARNSVIEDGYAGVVRNKAYMYYKNYSDNCVITVNSGTVWLKTNSELVVGDIIVDDHKSTLIVQELKDLAKKLKLSNISFQVCGGLRLYDLFAVNHKPVASFPVLLKDFGSGCDLTKIKFTFADLDIF